MASRLELNEGHGVQELCDISSEVKSGKQALSGATWPMDMSHVKRINQLFQPDR